MWTQLRACRPVRPADGLKMEAPTIQKQRRFLSPCNAARWNARVRSLARDLGSALNNGAHLESLRRPRIGPLTVLEEALEPKTWASAIPSV